ncbi:hypothetical protein [Intrasporangium flavum]|uniref:hypothetical protein n=1 Tax=Intrasporangium flavum TaxID=1428657 RepID=UPI00096BEAF3|nr:hypothetical protein [Intrasporangium flavum]
MKEIDVIRCSDRFRSAMSRRSAKTPACSARTTRGSTGPSVDAMIDAARYTGALSPSGSCRLAMTAN